MNEKQRTTQQNKSLHLLFSMKAQLGKKSTTELNTKDIDLVFNTLARHLSEKLGIVIDFPSKDV